MWWIWPLYIMCLVTVVFVSTKLAKYVDLLESRTKLSGALLGGILLAGITSLPELVTSATAALMGEPHMTQGNILGSNLFDVAIIGALLLTYPRKLRNTKLTKSNNVFLWTKAVITAIVLVFTITGVSVIVPFLNINILTLICIGLYILSIFVPGNKDEVHAEEAFEQTPADMTLTIKQIVTRFVLCALILVGVSVSITFMSDIIADVYGLGRGLAGALFLGIATSLPEIISSFALCRLGNFNTAMSNLMGSCLFNYMVLALADIFYFAGTVFVVDMQTIVLAGCLMAATLLTYLFYYLKRKKNERSVLFNIGFGSVIMLTYVIFLVVSTTFAL
ncbi:MAG: cation transporter [Clostridia bacterium]|nr:cation transporter [Clostridia bacterium]